MPIPERFLPLSETLLSSITTLQSIQAHRSGGDPASLPGVLRALTELSVLEFPENKHRLAQYREILWTRARDQKEPVLFVFKHLNPVITLGQLLCDAVEGGLNEVTQVHPGELLFRNILQESSSLGTAPVHFFDNGHAANLREILPSFTGAQRGLLVVCDWLLEGDEYRCALEWMTDHGGQIHDACGICEGDTRELLHSLSPVHTSRGPSPAPLVLLAARDVLTQAIPLIQTIYELNLESYAASVAEDCVYKRLYCAFSQLLVETVTSEQKPMLIRHALRLHQHGLQEGKPVLSLHRRIPPVFAMLFGVAVLGEVSLYRLLKGGLDDSDFPKLTWTASRLAEAAIEVAHVPPGVSLAGFLEKTQPKDLLVLCDWELHGAESQEAGQWARLGVLFEDSRGALEFPAQLP